MPQGKTLYVDKFTISLIGRIHSGDEKHNPSNAVGDEDPLSFLNLEAPLYKNPVRLQDWRASFFTFILPEDPGIEEARFRQWVPRHRMPEPKALPPSGDLGNGIIIKYSPEVAIRDDTSGNDISATLPLTFSRVRASDIPKADEQPKVRRQTLSDQGRQPSVELTVHFPSSLVQEAAFPLTLRHLGEALNPAAKGAPILRLVSCCLQLLEQTNTRIPPNNESSYVKQREIASRDYSASEDGSLPVITEEGLDLSEILRHPSIPCAFAPTFDYVNIRRSYGMKVLIQVQHDQTSSDLEFFFDDVTLWPYETYAMARSIEERHMDEDLYPDEDDWP